MPCLTILGRSFVVYRPVTPRHAATHCLSPGSLFFFFSSLSEHHVGSLRNMFKVLRLRILFDEFLNVPAGQVSFQILFHHKIHGCLPSQKPKKKNHILIVLTFILSDSILYGHFRHLFSCVLHHQN